ncbi:phosphoenolpyruvate synthase [Streptomyces kasugaensis]|uniref:Phosphoenolpyruvate synthase n=1 Tax=Streptomyces kasugaensis TaxID=1946 RepID=A0A4Q9HP74_STRKA|nr:PEP/pyruvate-binding domain-containing protein [Streptomyces kasugaensis]TBO56658.1 phosphoenolpyruvate synthase [Streptomyces kasugaensis]
MTTAALPVGAPGPVTDRTAVGGRLSLPLFHTLSGVLAGHPYLKVVVDRAEGTWHLLDTAVHPFHVDYVATRVLGMDLAALDACLDDFNASVYTAPERRFLLGVLSLHTDTHTHTHTDADTHTEAGERSFLVLETTEADTMSGALLDEFYGFVRHRVDDTLPLLLKPANHGQEQELTAIGDDRVPRILAHELFGNRTRTPLNPGEATGRLRHFRTAGEYAAAAAGLGRADIVAMACLPDDVPRVAGFLHSEASTPLSHTNVLAAGWGIPNAIVRDLDRIIERDGLNGAWVRYRVGDDEITLVPLAGAPAPRAADRPRPRIRLAPPRLADAPALPLHLLRRTDRDRYGTKAAQLGELHHVLERRTADLTAYYGRPRPPRRDLYGHLASRLGLPGAHPGDGTGHATGELRRAAAEFAARTVTAPDGIALPFALQHRFLISSPALRQAVRRLKDALATPAPQALDPLCRQLQHLIRHTPVPDGIVRRITGVLPPGLTGPHRLVVRSSANAEDLPGFSAAGVYASVTAVHGTGELLDAVRQVWASLFSPRGVLLRHQAGIAPDDTYMGVIIQRYVPAELGGVLVTCDPTRRADFRNVYLNCSAGSPERIVDGTVLPLQYLYNTVEGGGRTVSLGSAGTDLPAGTRRRLADLALTGRLLQSHFGDAAGDGPLDIEWLMTGQGAFRLVQIRPYAR